ncbi:MAG: hypothetical protein GXO47_02575 [Chlorobi bacterium]|nr:hypothetical protein [Chlorobiota bacterium]
MKKQLLYTLIRNPEELNEFTLDGIRSLVKEYPYFQAARILLLKNLHILDDVRFEPELKSSALYVPDREKLFGIISGLYKEPEISVDERSEKTENESEEKTTAENTPSTALTGNVGSVTDYFGFDEVTETMGGGTVEFSMQEKDEKGDAIDAVPDDMLFEYEKQGATGYYLDTAEYFPETGKSKSFSEWLDLVGKNAITSGESKSKYENKKNKTLDIIDSFLSNQEAIKKIVPEKNREAKPLPKQVVEKDALESDDLMTETLAGIYIKQGHYSRAIGIFKKLSLKYPEKSVYFAQQIEKLEKLISNQ